MRDEREALFLSLPIDVASRELDYKFQLERAAILSAAVGRARLFLQGGNADAAKEVLDVAALETRELLESLLPLFDTDRMMMPEAPDA